MPDTAKKKRYEGFERRIKVVSIGIAVAFAILGVRLWHLQIVQWYDFKKVAEGQRLHPQRLEAPRGIIYGADRSIVLAGNGASSDLVLVPAECGKDRLEAVCDTLEELVGVDAAALREEVLKYKKRPYHQILIKKDVSKSDVIRVEEFSYALPGVSTVATPQRRYAYGKTAGQILGYVGPLSKKELDQSDAYKWGDRKGRDGLERIYEDHLRGTDGKMVINVYASEMWPEQRRDAHGQPYVDVDSYGRGLEEQLEFRKEPIPGGSIFITLDIGLQRHCEEVLDGKVGAIAVLNADTGAAYALASSPGYDPTIFVAHGHGDECTHALRTKPNPMLNRCYREAYAPGSIFKVMLAAAALEEGIIDENTTFFCPGVFRLKGVKHEWNCWRRKYGGHGKIALVDALAESCDVFFYNVGLKLGVDKINEWALKMGLGVKTGIDLPREVPGLIPSRAWKEKALLAKYPDEPWNRRWFPGDTINLSIGQGSMTTSPLQAAVMTACIVNGARCVRPFLNMALAPQLSEPFLSERTLRIVREGMAKCVEEGTAENVKTEGMRMLGKTGSAQMVSLSKHRQYENEEDIPYKLRDHAWFVAGVMDREPKLAVCAFVEHGHHGNRAAAPLAKSAIEFFYASREPGGRINLASQGD